MGRSNHHGFWNQHPNGTSDAECYNPSLAKQDNGNTIKGRTSPALGVEAKYRPIILSTLSDTQTCTAHPSGDGTHDSIELLIPSKSSQGDKMNVNERSARDPVVCTLNKKLQQRQVTEQRAKAARKELYLTATPFSPHRDKTR